MSKKVKKNVVRGRFTLYRKGPDGQLVSKGVVPYAYTLTSQQLAQEWDALTRG